MGYSITAFALVFFLIVGNANIRRSDIREGSIGTGVASLVASDMLRIASSINDWRYDNVVEDGVVDFANIALMPRPDYRINHVIADGRLWIWTTSFPGLIAALSERSVTSALIGVATHGRLTMLDGTDMNLTLPVGVADGDVVYLN
ncbi:pilM family protein [Pectobacterium punjabense]|uniref:PilM family protein n=1 Tax=Pectobacterium punjabense TaxID=2108399 RepID=A0ABX6KZ01_9GAMM|nr:MULTISPECIES: type IV pilus biogenesis protein PilM [Pectobacterium]MBA0211955.1 type IV pilus biogenesis protein PilM [Pectobacterium brasiliense]MBS4430995.1 type IV pilus biogenesis protein PilM [Pectobacterium punjabense]PTA65558.1 pilM family protein [Pectobacterium punjabense]QJA19278.1 pilM family protein [Pectobacterium punjabense]